MCVFSTCLRVLTNLTINQIFQFINYIQNTFAF